MKRIGILGGSFNPIHFGHLLMAQSASEVLSLDKVYFVPAYHSPLKSKIELAPSKDRLSMVKLAIKGNPLFDVYDGELKRGGMSFTLETLQELTVLYPKAKFFLIIGGDQLRDFHRWKNPQGILKLASLAVLNRPGFDKNYPKRWPYRKVIMPAVDLSSSDIRERMKSKRSIWYLTPKAVIQYINRHRLYS